MSAELAAFCAAAATSAALVSIYAAASARTVSRAAPPPFMRRHGYRIAGVVALAQLVYAMAAVGAAAGAVVVLAAWMVFGILFVAAINAWPRPVFRCTCGMALFAIACAFMTVF